MSIFKDDGGGTQYTFLEAIHYGCALVLLTELVQNKKVDTTKITDNARKILK
jgi:hypothetical protein